VCGFWIAGRLFGVNILAVKEINRELGFTRVHHAPDDVRGYVNIRGQIHLVLDLRLMLGFDSVPTTPASRLVLFKPTVAESLGVLVDRIGDIVTVAADQIEWRDKQEAEHSPPSHRALIIGDGKLPGRVITLVDPRRLLSAAARR
jgi:purine-binding chemotaxis protein CheW